MKAPAPIKDGEERWLGYLETHKVGDIHRTGTEYPDKTSIEVSYSELEAFDHGLAEYLDAHPDMALADGKAAMKDILAGRPDLHDEIEAMDIGIEVVDVPKAARTPIRDIRQRHTGRLITIEGTAKRNVEVLPIVQVAAFKCARCGHVQKIPQDGPGFREPMECPKDEIDDEGKCGCGRAAATTKFQYIQKDSVLIDSQKIEIQEHPDSQRQGAQPHANVAYAYGDLAGLVNPGDKVIITGILRANRKKDSRTHEIHLDINSITFSDAQADDIDISPEDELEIKRLSQLPNILDIAADSIAPSICGHGIIKKAIILQACGGVLKTRADGTRNRGDIHVFLIGDPSTAKSQILVSISKLLPRGIYASGKGASAAGLTAACTRDEFGEGRWTIEAGVLALADGAIAAVDEFDKMEQKDTSAMHEAMEQQTVTINKATIRATLRSRCGVLAAGNPKNGRFYPGEPISSQIGDLAATLLSRFDLIFIVSDVPGDADNDIAGHILNSHLAGEVEARREIGEATPTRQAIVNAQEEIQAPIPRDMLRKYLWAARKVSPVLSDEAIALLKNHYIEIRSLAKLGGGAPNIPITARQLEAIIRLAEASAKLRLSDTVTKEDVQKSLEIFNEFLKGVDYDIDSLTHGPQDQAERMKAIRRIAVELAEADKLTYPELEKRALAWGIDKERCAAIFAQLKDGGDIYQAETREGVAVYRLMEAT